MQFEKPLLTRRQKKKIREWLRERKVEICCASCFVSLVLVDAVWWVLCFLGVWIPVICLWRCYRRDVARGDTEVERMLQGIKKPAGDTNTDEPIEQNEQG